MTFKERTNGRYYLTAAQQDIINDWQAEREKLIGVLEATKEAWESLEGNKCYSPTRIEKWLIENMKPVIDNIRAILAEKEKGNGIDA